MFHGKKMKSRREIRCGDHRHRARRGSPTPPPADRRSPVTIPGDLQSAGSGDPTPVRELTLAAYQVALGTRTQSTWLDLELDLWRALADKVMTWGQENGLGAANK